MRIHRIISTLFHPMVIPTIGVLVYFLIIPNQINSKSKMALMAFTFMISYILPLLLLIILKSIKLIKNFQLESIRERRIPLLIIITLFYTFGKALLIFPIVRDLGYLFTGTALSILIIYFIFFLKIKSSLHLVSFGNAVGFFLALSSLYSTSVIPIVIVFILVGGIVGSSRLYLKAHTPLEVYFGFFIGFLSQFFIRWLL